MVARSGTATRPSGSDSYPPVAGTKVPWVLAPILIRLAETAESLGWTVYSIGNADHLKKHGDHTPWSAGKQRGIVYAIDVMIPDAVVPKFTAWLLKYCKSDVDTTWIDFFNLGGSQYNYAGKRVASSSDHHLHLSVQSGKENAVSALFSAWKQETAPPPPPPAERLVKLAGSPAIYHVKHVPTMDDVTAITKRTGPVVTVDSFDELRSIL